MRFFVDRPVLATVIALILTLIGALASRQLAVEQYPNVAPPQVKVTATYPGASPEILENTVAAPLEREMNGVNGLLYMYSTSSSSGLMELFIVFEAGTNIDIATVEVNNRVKRVEALMPQPVLQNGIRADQTNPQMLQIVTLYSEDPRFDKEYLANLANASIIPEIKRLFTLDIHDKASTRMEIVHGSFTRRPSVWCVERKASIAYNGGDWIRETLMPFDYSVSDYAVYVPRKTAVPSLMGLGDGSIVIDHNKRDNVRYATSGQRYVVLNGVPPAYLDRQEPQYTEGHARTFFGLDRNGNLMVCVCNGLYPNMGLTLKEAARDILVPYGALIAFDGGGGEAPGLEEHGVQGGGGRPQDQEEHEGQHDFS